MKSIHLVGSHASSQYQNRYYPEFTVYMRVLQLHMMKWMDDVTRKRLKIGERFENRDLFKSV